MMGLVHIKNNYRKRTRVPQLCCPDDAWTNKLFFISNSPILNSFILFACTVCCAKARLSQYRVVSNIYHFDMFPLSSKLLLLAIHSLSLLSAVNAETCSSNCDDVHFFLARGNNEPYPGRQGALVAATCDGLSSCGYEDLIYSALYTDLSCQSTYNGNIAGHVQLSAYAEKCPNSKLILAGYSQGAAIITDILGGGGGVSFNGCVQPDTPALDRTTSPGSHSEYLFHFSSTPKFYPNVDN